MKFSLPTRARESTTLFSTSKEHFRDLIHLFVLPCERLRGCEMQSEFRAGNPGPPAAAGLYGGQLMSWRDGGEMMFHEKFEPFSCNAIRAAVTRPPRLHPPLASEELQGVTTSTTSQPFHQVFFFFIGY